MTHETRGVARRRDLMSDAELQRQSREFLAAVVRAAETSGIDDLQGLSWKPVRDLLDRISQSRAEQGFTPSETATFVFSLKQPLFARLRGEIKEHAALA